MACWFQSRFQSRKSAQWNRLHWNSRICSVQISITISNTISVMNFCIVEHGLPISITIFCTVEHPFNTIKYWLLYGAWLWWLLSMPFGAVGLAINSLMWRDWTSTTTYTSPAHDTHLLRRSVIATKHIFFALLWPPYGIGQAIIFLPCGFYLPLSSFFSSPNLSGRRLDVYHTSTHGVALVQI